jgi:hypothetical protein
MITATLYTKSIIMFHSRSMGQYLKPGPPIRKQELLTATPPPLSVINIVLVSLNSLRKPAESSTPTNNLAAMQSLTFGRSNCDVLLPVTFCAASRSY